MIDHLRATEHRRSAWTGVTPVFLALLFLAAMPARALINPKVQPRHYFESYKVVLGCRVTKVDSGKLTATLEIENAAKGAAPAKTITLKAADPKLLEEILALGEGQLLVAFAGRDRPRSGVKDVVYYAGGGKWFKARLTDQADQWELLADLDAGLEKGSADIGFGIFNGAVEQLWAMMQDLGAGRAYFPAKPAVRFSAKKIAKLDKAVHGVALFDLNADGRLDIVAASEIGVRVFLQNEKGEFDDRTVAWGLAGVKSCKSVSLADADGDGASDLLLDGALYVQKGGRLEASDMIPKQSAVLSAAFVELNGDGKPDVVISRENGGLAAFVNDGKAFTDATAKLGFDKKENGAGATGYFEAGDWNADGRTDLIHLTGAGLLLLNGEKGFTATAIGQEGERYEFGAAAMAPIVEPAKSAAFIPMADGKMLIERDADGLRDITRYGNEIQDDIPGMLGALAEDLNADGTLDIYATTKASGTPSFFVMNRGYGSFMVPGKYTSEKTFPPEVFNQPASGLAAGDATGDGANDLLVGARDGTLSLLVNEILTDRPAAPDVSTALDERKQIAARLVTVRLAGKAGVVGASVKLTDAEGRLIAARQVGGNIGVGCAGPHQFSFAAREPGRHTVELTLPGGRKVTAPVDLSAAQPRHQTLTLTTDVAK